MLSLFYTKCDESEMAQVAQVMSSGVFVNGPHTAALEDELTAYMGCGGVATCASGTDALVLALEGLNCDREECGIIVPAMTFSATYEAVLKAGATPIVCDVDETTGTPTLEIIRDAMATAIYQGKPVAGVILVHLYGWPAVDTIEIANFCREHNIALIEDCAQAFGASLDGIKVGRFGDVAAFSFYPTKPLGGIGDGGMLYSRDIAIAEVARARRNHGRTKDGQMMPGYNSRLAEVDACVLRGRLRAHDMVMDSRRAISGRYHSQGLKKLALKRKGVGIPYVYPILVDDREAVRFRLADIGVQTLVHYDPPVSDLPYVGADCPNAKWLSRKVLSLPCHQGMTVEDVDRISDAVRG